MAIQAQTFEFVRTLVHKRAAIVLEPGKEYLVESRLAPLARAEGFKTIDDLVQRLAATAVSPLHTKVVEAMTTNETTFYRDLHPFEALKTVILPRLIAARAATRRLTIWSAACSSGQEPVTLAMLIKEHFPELANWRVTLLATDLSSVMVERTRAGRFSQLEVNRGLPAPMLLKYFTKVGTDWLVREDIRAMIDCQVMNLATPWPVLPPMDLILMRNVLIYFDTTMKRDIFRKVRHTLAPDGYLMLGSAETTMALDDAFVRAPVGSAVVYQYTAPSARTQYA